MASGVLLRACFFTIAASFAFAASPAMANVTTLAGNGRAGTNDGPATAAAFLVPAAVAVGADGTVYVADAGAQNIRRIRRGRTDTLTGKSDGGSALDDRTGGYVDGPLRVARFERPIGLAIDKSGALYVADAGNDCIRKIAHGTVSTFAGSPKRGTTDGSGRAASFENIRALTIDDDGNLYVADYGTGIRKITPAGAVTTLALPSQKKTIVAVGARGSGARLVLAYSDGEALHALAGGTHQSVRYDDPREPGSSGLTVGYADAIVVVNENTLVVCDDATNAVRLVRLPAPPFVTDTMTRALVGGIREGADNAGGLADGPPESALVATPLGIALAADGSIVVADAGNRRVRRIARIDTRESVLPDLRNLNLPKDAYTIAVIGNSYAFFNVLWPESIPGTIEASLDRDAPALAMHRRPNVVAFRIDDVSTTAVDSLVDNVLGDGQVRLIVLLDNYFDPPDPALVRALERKLARSQTKLLVVFTPQGYEVSPLEFWKAAQSRDDYNFATLRAQAARQESFYNRVGVRTLLLLDAMAQEENRNDRHNLFYGADHHFTVFGAGWVGRQIADEIERWRPWR